MIGSAQNGDVIVIEAQGVFLTEPAEI